MGYYAEHKRETVQEAKRTLEDQFGISVSLADRMFLRRYVIEVIDATEEMTKEQLVESPDPILEGVGKFLMTHRDYLKLAKPIWEISAGNFQIIAVRLV